MADYPIVASGDDLMPCELDTVRVVGKYVQVDVRMRKTEPPVFQGHAGILLDDETLVLLEPIWDKNAIRPDHEIDRFKGRRVAATGMLFPTAPDSFDPTQANLRLPCITDIESIELVATAGTS